MAFSGVHFLTILLPLIGIALMFTGGYAWQMKSFLYLPISGLLGLASSLLPILSLMSIQYMRIGSGASRKRGGNGPRLTEKMFIGAFVLLILDAVVITLASTSIPSSQISCPLDARWSTLYRTNLPAIKRIQDAFDCCGYHSSADKFYPKPDHPPEGTHPKCTDTYPTRVGRVCYPLWRGQNQRIATLIIVVAIVSAVMKIGALLFLRVSNHPMIQKFLYSPWFKSSQQPHQGVPDSERIRPVDDDEEQYRYEYDNDARPRVDTGYIATPRNNSGYLEGAESERLLGNGNPYNESDIDASRRGGAGFGTVQASLLG
ncbi:hypothetical protein BDZ91DRAFT_798987 [Kalaharituber pfeilii]|nr:hypothetical protein BDZ91DRAFT_798987 [Kalaharituber pfeilii]